MLRSLRWLTALCLVVCLGSLAPSQEAKKFSIKTTATPVPKEISAAVGKLLENHSVQLLDGAGQPICDVWFRKDLPAEATPEQLKSGVTFREVKQTEILGAIQFHKAWTDYRKQKIKAGVYTLRLAYQPTDGKHTADISEFQDFAVVIGAKNDIRPDLLDAKMMQENSGESIGSGHPGVFMLWPTAKLGKEPTLAAQPKNHWVVNNASNLVVGGKATATRMGIGLTLVGHSPAE